MVGRHDDFLAGLAAAVSGLAPDDRRSRAYWPALEFQVATRTIIAAARLP
jgi:hypothetical protein